MEEGLRDLIIDENDPPAPTEMVAPAADEASDGPAEAPPEQDLVELRLERITDYLDSTLHNPLPEVALIGGVNADLGKLAVGIGQAIDEVLAACQNGREYLDAAPQAADVLLKVGRQIERGARLAHDLSRGQPGTKTTLARNGGLLEQSGEMEI